MTGDHLWESAGCAGRLQPRSFAVYRVVESQEKVATMNLVDTFEEQDLLEHLLDGSKPPQPPAAEGLHYLLMTPFRYPPLRHGSRFGRTHERGLFYGGLALPTALGECAYYRLVFLEGMAEPFAGVLTTYHTSFRAEAQAKLLLDLTEEAFAPYQQSLQSKLDYRLTQELGSRMRDEGVDAVIYWSARCQNSAGLNAAIFEPGVLQGKPGDVSPWACRTTRKEVRFTSSSDQVIHSFPRSAFLVDEHLPQPAVA